MPLNKFHAIDCSQGLSYLFKHRKRFWLLAYAYSSCVSLSLILCEPLIYVGLGVTFDDFRVAMFETGTAGKYDIIAIAFGSTAHYMLPFAFLICFKRAAAKLETFVREYGESYMYCITEGIKFQILRIRGVSR